MTVPSTCYKCGTWALAGVEGDVVECGVCKRKFVFGETREQYDESVRMESIKRAQQEKADSIVAEAEAREEERKFKQMLRRVKTDSVVRATEYLEWLRNGGFPTKSGLTNKAHIYVLKLNKPQGMYWKQHRFPNDEFPPIVDPDSDECQGFVYVGHTQRVSTDKVPLDEYDGDPVLYRFYDEHIAGEGNNSPVVTKHRFSKDFETCGRELTDRYGFRFVSTVKPKKGEIESYKLESWVGYMLYKLGYWVWGPHAHNANHKAEYGDFLGKGIYL